MRNLESFLDATEIHPIDIVETLAEYNAWDFDRVADDQIAMAIEGAWRTYSITLAWSGRDETLRLICSFEMEPPANKLAPLYELLNDANEKCWSGAFMLWREHGLMAYRYGLCLTGGEMAGRRQIDHLVQSAVSACERFYPAFQLVCWGEETPKAAIKIALEESYGTA
ncbi:MAG: YbjN domain-containing protein [Paracoccaceae bacterium]